MGRHFKRKITTRRYVYLAEPFQKNGQARKYAGNSCSDKIKKSAELIFLRMNKYWWSCRESNPGPNIFVASFLHVYFGINCRDNAGTKQTNIILSRMVLSSCHGIQLQQPVFVLSRRRSMVTSQPARRP